MSDRKDIPFVPVNGRVLIEFLPYRPSKLLEVLSVDKADHCEGIVAALSPCKYGRRKLGSKGWEHTGEIFPHEVKVGQRVLFLPKYLDDDMIELNRKKFRCLDAWEIVGVIEEAQPEGYEDLKTGKMLPDKHPLLIHP